MSSVFLHDFIKKPTLQKLGLDSMIAQPRAVTFGSQDRKFHSPSGCPVNLMEMKDRAVSCKPKGNTDLDGLTDNVPIERLLSARFPLLVRNNDNTKLKSYLSVILLSTSYSGCKALIDVNGNDTRFFMAKGHRYILVDRGIIM